MLDYINHPLFFLDCWMEKLYKSGSRMMPDLLEVVLGLDSYLTKAIMEYEEGKRVETNVHP